MDNDLLFHYSALYEGDPYDVSCLAIDESRGILAIARRRDNSGICGHAIIEYWSVIGDLNFHLRTVALGDHGSAQSCIWIGLSLVSSHVDGCVMVHDIHSYSSVHQISSCPIWCLCAVKGTDFCAGTDSGMLILLTLSDRNLSIATHISLGFSSRVFSIASDGKVVAAGSVDCIYMVDIRTKKFKSISRLPRNEKRKPTIIWSIQFVNGKLASGDSRGCVCLWDVTDGSLIQVIESHKADILVLCHSNGTIYAAGVDPCITKLQKVPSSDYRLDLRRRLHGNDVRAMTATNGTIFSGGAEHFVAMSSKEEHSFCLKNIPCSVALDANLLIYQYSDRIVLWKTALCEENQACQYPDLKQDPVKLAEIALNDLIHASDITRNGEFIAIATTDSLRIYSIKISKSNCDVKAVLRCRNSFTSLIFISGEGTNPTLIAASACFVITSLIFNVENEKKPRVVESCQHEEGGVVLRMHANSDTVHAEDIVILTTKNLIFHLNLRNSMVLRKLNLTSYPVVMDAQVTNQHVYLLCANRNESIVEYSLLCGRCQWTAASTDLRFEGESIVEMRINHDKLALVGERGTVRCLILQPQNKYIWHNDDANVKICDNQNVKANAFAMSACFKSAMQSSLDRCCGVRWISDGYLMLNIPRMFSEPSRMAFRIKYFGQN